MNTHFTRLAAIGLMAAISSGTASAVAPGYAEFRLAPQFSQFLTEQVDHHQDVMAAPISRIETDNTGTTVTWVELAEFRFETVLSDAFWDDVVIAVTDLRLNAQDGTIEGDFSIDRLVSGPQVALNDTAVFRAGEISRNDGLLTFSQLTIHPEIFSFFSRGWGLSEPEALALSQLPTLGTITVSPVPEPSTYALLGVGLVGVQLGLRRRHRAAACAEA